MVALGFVNVYCYAFSALSLAMLFGKIPVSIGSVVLVAAASATIATPLAGGVEENVTQLKTTVSQCELPTMTAPLAYMAALLSCVSG